MSQTTTQPAFKSVRPSDPNTTDDYQSALAAVTGTTVDLHGAALPAGGFVQLLSPGTEGAWWTFSAFGQDFFSVDFNHPATEAWAAVVQTMQNLAPELAAGKYGLMDLPRLRDAVTMAQGLGKKFTDSVQTLKGIVTPLENEESLISGTAVSVLLDQMHLIGDLMHADAMELIDHPSPAVADVLDDAAEALSAFGVGMANAFWQSDDALLNAIANGWNSIFTNMLNYLDQTGLISGSQKYNSLAANPATAIAYAQLMLGRYSSTVAGPLDHGIAPISGDLSQSPVWAATDAAIKHLIAVELDQLDVVARKVSADLKTAYDNATNRLNAAGVTFPVQPAQSRIAVAADQPALQARTRVTSAAPVHSTTAGSRVPASEIYPS